MRELERRLHFKEQCKDYFRWCFKLWLCSEQQGLNGGEPRLIMQPAWPSLIRIISAHCFTAATGPLNAKRFCRPISCSVSHCDLLLFNGSYSVVTTQNIFWQTEVLGFLGFSKSIIKSVILWQEWALSTLKQCHWDCPAEEGPLK